MKEPVEVNNGKVTRAVLDERTLRLEEKIEALKELQQTKDATYEERYVRNEKFQAITERLAETYLTKDTYRREHEIVENLALNLKNEVSGLKGQLLAMSGGGLLVAVALIVLEIIKK